MATQADHTEAADGLPSPRRYWAGAALMVALSASVLDGTIANVALPTIAADLKADPAAAIWIVNASQIAAAAALLPLASMGEVIGFRRLAQTGLIVFTLASLGAGLSHGLAELTAWRVLQGLGASGIMAITGAMTRHIYPHRMLGRAVGINALTISVAAVMGPTIASLLLSFGDWRFIFFFNVPIGIVATIVALLNLPQTSKTARPLNLRGAALSVATFGMLTTGAQTLAHGARAIGLALLAASLATGWALFRYERHRTDPLVPFDLLKIPLFALSAIAAIITFIAQTLAFVSLPFELHRLGHTAVETGLLMTPWPAAVAIAAFVAGHLVDRFPASVLGVIGLLTFSAGLLALYFLPAEHSALDLTWRMALAGVGFGFFQTPNNRLILGLGPRARAGAAGGTLGTSRVLGQCAGAAIAALLFSLAPDTGSRIALAVAAGIALAAAAFSLLRLREEPPPGSVPPAPRDSEAQA